MRHINVTIFAILLPALAFAHAGGHDIKGTIVKIEKDLLVIKKVDGASQTIPLSQSTTYRVGDAAGKWQDMRAGSRVVVHIGHDGRAIEVHLPARK